NGFAGSSFSLRIKGSGIPGINAVGDLNISLTSGAAGGSYSSPGGTTSDPQVNRTGLTAAELGNTFYFAATSDSPLPVELTSFSAVREDKSVILYWITETEVNNYGFEILRTTQDDDKWEVLGFVRGHGNSNSPNNYTFIDNKVGNTGKCYYKLKMIDNDGTNEFSKTIEVNFNFPISFELRQNYPNPFNPNTKISWQSPVPGLQNLKVYDIMGKEVATLVNEYKQAGNYEIEFDGTALASGVYFYKLSVNNFVSIKKMILLR
ncbi:MAG: T9SS type A sorting domain-containing protein, partial [Ignavibacteriota bacterium]